MKCLLGRTSVRAAHDAIIIIAALQSMILPFDNNIDNYLMEQRSERHQIA